MVCFCLNSCGITFPNGPSSDPGDLGMGFVVTELQPLSTFDLKVEFENENYIFSWEAPFGISCLNYFVVIVPTPTVPDPGIMNAFVLRHEGDTLTYKLEGSEELNQLVEENPGKLSALILCNQFNNPYDEIFQRSDFESLSDIN